MSPILPFMTEHIWQNMVREVEKSEKESIFLSSFPTASDVRFPNLDEQTQAVREIIAIGQRLRNENQIKVKQPLKTMFLNVNEETKKAAKTFEQIIKDELNIKEIVFENDNNKFNDAYLTVNFKTAGAVLKGDVQKLKNMLLEATEEQVQNFVSQFKEGKVSVFEFENLDSSLFNLCYKAKEEYVIATENDITVVLDVTIDENLMLEGLARELIRSIQVLRKQANFKVEERISIAFLDPTENIKRVIEIFGDRIKQEVLARQIEEKIENPSLEEKIELSDESTIVQLKN